MSRRIPSEAKWIGTRFIATVGEPWNFVSSRGEGLVEGSLGEIYTDRDGTDMLALEIFPFLEGEREIRWLLGAKRYADASSLSCDIEKRKNITLNMFYIRDEKNIVQQFIEDEEVELKKIEGVSFIIGTIKEYIYV